MAISVSNLSKCYQIYDTPRDRLKQFVAPRLQSLAGQSPRQYFREFWALKDVSFEVRKGETVGIIGRNGSGKSTLLQIICGTLHPTSGSIQTNGRIAALLELGSGFNPEFTGRENVYMNAAVLGLSTEEIDARFDDIAAFAEIGDFIEQPVKTYSSGMVVRLAFAVAINVDPEILIVDEALSVGDELFQRKCFSRIEAIKQNGATILFVSHSGSTVVELCGHAVLLDSGEKLAMGAPKSIVGKYQKLIYAPQDKRSLIREEIRTYEGDGGQSPVAAHAHQATSQPAENKRTTENEPEEFFDPNLKPQSTLEYESHGAFIGSPEILTLSGEKVNCLKRGKGYRYAYKVRFDQGATNVRFGMMIKTISGLELGGGVSAPSISQAISYQAAGTSISVEFRFICNLNPGLYFLNAGVTGSHRGEETFLHRVLDLCMFRVMPISDNTTTGIIDFGCVAEIELENNSL
ncbi:MAG: ABC transporter ATP-binding protein [Hydrogenophilales bacterium 17-64-65]|nr:MAG: ABC transporter ATP-binding protein [Hydrogenophilales bacterium 16-64-40]OZA34544.1 MAG: ABC transporter ATP-binding protein [Hydrogenophilales bacterium 17-64-65]